MEFNNLSLVNRSIVKVIDRGNIRDFIKEFLTDTEIEAIKNKVMGKDYNYNAFSRAKKKLEEIGLEYKDISHLV